MGYDGLSIDVWLTPHFQVGLVGGWGCMGQAPAVGSPIVHWTCHPLATCRAVAAPVSNLTVMPTSPLCQPQPLQAFIDVKHAGRGPGATELRQPFADAFEAGFFEEKAAFDKALQVGGWTAGGSWLGAGECGVCINPRLPPHPSVRGTRY